MKFSKENAIMGEDLIATLLGATISSQGSWSNHCRWLTCHMMPLTTIHEGTNELTALEVRNPKNHDETIIVAAWREQ